MKSRGLKAGLIRISAGMMSDRAGMMLLSTELSWLSSGMIQLRSRMMSMSDVMIRASKEHETKRRIRTMLVVLSRLCSIYPIIS